MKYVCHRKARAPAAMVRYANEKHNQKVQWALLVCEAPANKHLGGAAVTPMPRPPTAIDFQQEGQL